jgi:uncharacterized protein YukE
VANIDVDYGVLEETAAVIEGYIAGHRRHNQAIEEELRLLGSQWRGTDYNRIVEQWQRMEAPDSESGRLLRELETQAKKLRWASARYKSLQKAAISRAKRLR